MEVLLALPHPESLNVILHGGHRDGGAGKNPQVQAVTRTAEGCPLPLRMGSFEIWDSPASLSGFTFHHRDGGSLASPREATSPLPCSQTCSVSALSLPKGGFIQCAASPREPTPSLSSALRAFIWGFHTLGSKGGCRKVELRTETSTCQGQACTSPLLKWPWALPCNGSFPPPSLHTQSLSLHPSSLSHLSTSIPVHTTANHKPHRNQPPST